VSGGGGSRGLEPGADQKLKFGKRIEDMRERPWGYLTGLPAISIEIGSVIRVISG